MNRLGALLAVILVLAALPLSPGLVTAQDPDFDISGGHFYTQANGQGGAGGTGFSITDEGGVAFWTGFQALEGVPGVGFVSSRRFQHKGFTSQATQKYVFQWQPGQGLFFLNVFDELSELGKDEFLATVRSIPRPAVFEEAGKPFNQVTAERLALLNANPAIKAVYMASADPVRTHGLPTSRVEDVGPAFVIRNQRDAIQQWKVDMPFARAGEVTIVNGGDIAKEVGLVPVEAAAPETPPGTTPAPPPAPAPLPAPAPVPPPATPYGFQALTWEPNCGLTQIKVYVRDAAGFFINNVRVVVAAGAGGFSTISVPTGQEGRDPGWTNVVLRQEAVAEPWKVWVIDDAGIQISPAVDVVTDTRGCEPTGSGHQVGTVVFVRGAPVPAAPAGPVTIPFVHAGIFWEPNCGMTLIKIRVLDPEARAMDGVQFHIEIEDGTWSATSVKTGSEGRDTGWTDFFLSETPKAGTWKIWAVDVFGNRLSNTVFVVTDEGPCEPEREGHQVATLHFQQVAPVVTPTPLFPYTQTKLSWAASCVQTQLNILVRDKSGNPVNGVVFRVETDGVTYRADALPTGSTNQGDGWTNFWLRDEPFALRLNLFPVNSEGGPMADIFRLDTTDQDCSSSGHQVATIEYVKN